MSLPSSGLNSKPSKKPAGSKQSMWLAKIWDNVEAEWNEEANPPVTIIGSSKELRVNQ
jgi:hypothetical protein